MRILVFGSNLSGHHGKGAALTAKKQWGAVRGNGYGFQGQSYAIPTKGERTPYGTYPILSLEEIRASVNLFLLSARGFTQSTFLVTRIGCGLAGYQNAQIAPMFTGAPENCEFDPAWAPWGLPSWKEKP